MLSVSRADFYLTKPYDRKDIAEAIERARLLSARLKKRVYLRTFGKFDMFVDGQVVHFTNNKAKNCWPSVWTAGEEV